ncbi:MAG: class I SAM-dependent methyltransferase [Candidatus Omnitrophica bacterium]|nr:class I SAM-dependent methyltransferase [Candidatus Omnitrophota bacterium]
MSQLEQKLKKQFATRSSTFDDSANWITDKNLIRVHMNLAGKPRGKALDLCCGTGRIGRALLSKGWDVEGLDICGSMAGISSRYFPVSEGSAEKMPFESKSFHLLICRQTFQFLNTARVLSEISRVLVPDGVFIVSLTVPFSDDDRDWLSNIHRCKQPLLLKFYTAEDLMADLARSGFEITANRTCVVRESVNRWMEYAPELSQSVRDSVVSMVKNAPPSYKKKRHVEVVDGEVLEDWNWIVLKTVLSKKNKV